MYRTGESHETAKRHHQVVNPAGKYQFIIYATGSCLLGIVEAEIKVEDVPRMYQELFCNRPDYKTMVMP